MWWMLVLACGAPTPEAPQPAAEPVAVADPVADAAALDRAGAAAGKLGMTLKGRLTEAMGAGGPTAAVTVCADEAQGIAAKVAGETGVKVGRSSTRLRNPADAPPGWVEAWLKEMGDRPAAEATPVARVDVVDGIRTARVIKPIAVEAPCVACHGPKDQLAPEITASLATRYPTDAAVGYAAGDLRGALWAEVPVSR